MPQTECTLNSLIRKSYICIIKAASLANLNDLSIQDEYGDGIFVESVTRGPNTLNHSKRNFFLRDEIFFFEGKYDC